MILPPFLASLNYSYSIFSANLKTQAFLPVYVNSLLAYLDVIHATMAAHGQPMPYISDIERWSDLSIHHTRVSTTSVPPISWFTYIYSSSGRCCGTRDGLACNGCTTTPPTTQGDVDTFLNLRPCAISYHRLPNPPHRTPCFRKQSVVNGAVHYPPPPPLSQILPHQTTSFSHATFIIAIRASERTSN